MTQQLVPVNGGVETVETTVNALEVKQLSPQYIESKKLQPLPTQWVPGGRPIYRRLPAVSETYQLDFFNFISPPNTSVAADVEDIGYVYIAPGNPLANFTCQVSSSENKQNIFIQGGNIVWKYGKTVVPSTVLEVSQLSLNSGRYALTYQLEYNSTPRPLQYRVNDYSLEGHTLTLDSSTDSIGGWRYKTENAFLESNNYWTNYDNSFTSGPQPNSAQLTWISPLPAAFTNIKIFSPASIALDFSTEATLEILNNGQWTSVSSTKLSTEGERGVFNFTLTDPKSTNGWRVVWSTPTVKVPKIYVENIRVSGEITLLRPPSGLSPLAALAIYDAEDIPSEFTQCPLAVFDITPEQTVENIRDTRYLIFRDYQPVANWLTDFWDSNLINLYDQVSNYKSQWMEPQSCLFPEYLDLTKYGIYLPDEIPLASIVPN